MPSVLVTGASRGIGAALAASFAAHGWEVYAGMRQCPETSVAGTGQSERFNALPLDVTSEEDVSRLASLLPERLDALVNNAGISVSGPVEGLTEQALRRQFEVNVIGQLAVTRAVMPKLRLARGRIVFVSSVSALLPRPLIGAYGASKAALAALAASMRIELRPWGIRVIVIEPGMIDTDLWRDVHLSLEQAEDSLDPQLGSLYAGHFEGLRRRSAQTKLQTEPVEKVVSVVHRALHAKHPRARYVVGSQARKQLVRRTFYSTARWDAITAKRSGVPELPSESAGQIAKIGSA